MEHGDRGLRAGQTGLSAARTAEVWGAVTPILVNSTPNFITFSFEDLEDSRILSYELQLKDVDSRAILGGGYTGDWLSDRVQFFAQSTSSAVRLMSGGCVLLFATSWTGCRWCYSLVKGVRG